jgi:hypothetical protein
VKTLVSIIEDNAGNVIGASTNAGDVFLEKTEIVPRAQLKQVAVTLATKYGVTIPTELLPLVTTPNP